jgi:hypothetical protein
MDFLAANELAILRWVHILAMVYWLGGEWGVFQTSYHVTNPALSLDERKRHMETAYRIDILARTGIVLLLPLGLHMGKLFGFVPLLDGAGVWWMWLFFAVWLSMTWTAFLKRETDIGIRVTRAEEVLRYPLIAALFVFAGMALAGGGGPIESGAGNHWYPAKMALYAFALCIGLFLRVVMRRWTERFRALAAGPDAAQEAALASEIGQARIAAYIYWITIASVCFLGAVKPF